MCLGGDYFTKCLRSKIISNFDKNYKRGPFGGKNSEKVSQCRKKMKVGPFGLARYFVSFFNLARVRLDWRCNAIGMLRGKTGKTFLVQFARPNGAREKSL